jgi:Family of unknown function (DUF6214)
MAPEQLTTTSGLSDLLRLDASTAVDRFFRATWTSSDLPGVEVELQAEVTVERGRAIPRCTELIMRADESASVTGELLRRVPVARILAQAVVTPLVMVKIDETRPGTRRITGHDLTPDKLYERYVEGARRPRRGSPITDENLEQVAELYRAAVGRGDPPTQTVADAMGIPRSTAARWVAKARERKLLGPSLRGRGGEQER